MPLGDRTVDDSKSKLCGLETDFMEDMARLVHMNVDQGGFDYVVAPLINPNYRPSFTEFTNRGRVVLPFAGLEHLNLFQCRANVIGKISSWIDLDSEDDKLRNDSEITLKREIERASFMNLRSCVLPTPKSVACVNYARCVNEILQNLKNTKLWLRVPLKKFDDDAKDANSNQMVEGRVDSWEMWNSFRHLCEYHHRLAIVLDVSGPLPSVNSIGRWFGEPVKAAIIHTNTFTTNSKGPFLSKRRQNLVIDLFSRSMQVIISGKLDQDALSENYTKQNVQSHPFKPYIDCLGLLYQNMDPYAGLDLDEFGERDYLEKPFQPLRDNLQSLQYRELDKNEVKFNKYQEAIAQALVDKISDKEAPTAVAVLIVVGIGNGFLGAALKASRETRRRVRVYAVEKNLDAIISLEALIDKKKGGDLVSVIYCDLRFLETDDKADILVSDLLGSFGDNELLPECLAKARELLKDDAIFIPASCTSFLQPITSSLMYNKIKKYHNSQFETPYTVNLYSVARIAPSKRVFTFYFPDNSTTKEYKNYKKMEFKIHPESGSVLVHGFAGYFEAILYRHIRLCTEPSRVTPKIRGWFPLYFPLTEPVYIASGNSLDFEFWRCCSPKKVWYEWSVTSPTISHVHNSCGISYSVDLFPEKPRHDESQEKDRKEN